MIFKNTQRQIKVALDERERQTDTQAERAQPWKVLITKPDLNANPGSRDGRKEPYLTDTPTCP